MAEILLLRGETMLLDDDCVHLFEGKQVYAIKSRNTKYAYFGKNGIAHRLICGVTDKSLVVDHVNGNGLDNRKINLRVVSSADNVKNRQWTRGKELPPGVFRFRGGYMVQITHNYKKLFVGTFVDKGLAIAALNAKRKELGRPPVH